MEKNFDTVRWLIVDFMVFVLAAIIASGAAYTLVMGLVGTFGLEDLYPDVKGYVIVAGVMVAAFSGAIVMAAGIIALYDVVVKLRHGREVGLLERTVLLRLFNRA